MKLNMMLSVTILMCMAPNVFASIPQERRDMAAFVGGKSECDARIKAIAEEPVQQAANVAKPKAQKI
jgi:hypothetical protein